MGGLNASEPGQCREESSMMRNKEESRDRQEGNGGRRFGTVPHIVLIDRRALTGDDYPFKVS